MTDSEIPLLGDVLHILLGPEVLKEVLRTICTFLEMNPGAPIEAVVKHLNATITVPESVITVLNYDDKTRTRRKEMSKRLTLMVINKIRITQIGFSDLQL